MYETYLYLLLLLAGGVRVYFCVVKKFGEKIWFTRSSALYVYLFNVNSNARFYLSFDLQTMNFATQKHKLNRTSFFPRKDFEHLSNLIYWIAKQILRICQIRTWTFVINAHISTEFSMPILYFFNSLPTSYSTHKHTHAFSLSICRSLTSPSVCLILLRVYYNPY